MPNQITGVIEQLDVGDGDDNVGDDDVGDGDDNNDGVGDKSGDGRSTGDGGDDDGDHLVGRVRPCQTYGAFDNDGIEERRAGGTEEEAPSQLNCHHIHNCSEAICPYNFFIDIHSVELPFSSSSLSSSDLPVEGLQCFLIMAIFQPETIQCLL